MAITPSMSGGTSPVYDPMASLQGGGGPATNMAAGSPAYGAVEVAKITVGFNKAAKRPTDPHQAKLFGDSYQEGRTAIQKTPAQLLREFEQLSRKDFLKFRNLLIAAGYTSEGADALTVRSDYEALLNDVYTLQQSGRGGLTPGALLNNLIRMNGLDPKKIGSDEDFSTAIKEQLKPYKQTETSVYDLTPEEARSTLEQAMAQKLGRAPSEEEIEDFIAAAQTRAERNPTSVTASFTPGDTGLEGESSSTHSEGGTVTQRSADGTLVTSVERGFDSASLERMAERRAKNAPDYASYQAISSYFPAFLQALGSTV